VAVKEEKIEVEGEVVEALLSITLRVQPEDGHDVLAKFLREDAQELHPHPSRRSGQARALSLRPHAWPDRLSPEVAINPMKVRPSVKPMCERCRVIKRHGRTIVICSNPRHKQRQG